jgi:Flp pilus assembly protein protease CpaA
MTFEIAVAALGTAALAWAAGADVKTREIPAPAGFGMLGLGVLVLLLEKWYVGAAYFVLAIWCTRGKGWQYLLLVGSAVMLWAYQWQAAPLVVGVLLVTMIFRMKWFGGGDAQLAMGLVGVGHDWLVMGLVFGLTILVGIVTVIVRRGSVTEGARRLLWVARNLNAQPDSDAIRTPWAVVAAIGGVAYLWLWAVVL